MDDLGCLAPPDGVAQEYHIIVLHIFHAAGNSRPGIGIVLFLIGPAVVVAVVQILAGVGGFRDNLIKVSIQNCLDVLGNALCVSSGGEIGNQSLAAFRFRFRFRLGGHRGLGILMIAGQNGGHLGAGGLPLGLEEICAHTAHIAVLSGPVHCNAGPGGNTALIRKIRTGVGGGAAGVPPQHGGHLLPGKGIICAEQAAAVPADHPIPAGP